MTSSKWAYPDMLSNPNDDRFGQDRQRYLDEAEFWEWYYDEYDPYDEPPSPRRRDLEYNEVD